MVLSTSSAGRLQTHDLLPRSAQVRARVLAMAGNAPEVQSGREGAANSRPMQRDRPAEGPVSRLQG